MSYTLMYLFVIGSMTLIACLITGVVYLCRDILSFRKSRGKLYARISFWKFLKSNEAHPENWRVNNAGYGLLIRENVIQEGHKTYMNVSLATYWDLLKFRLWNRRKDREKRRDELQSKNAALKMELHKEQMEDLESGFRTWVAEHPEHSSLAVLLDGAEKDGVVSIDIPDRSSSPRICLFETDGNVYEYISTESGVIHAPLNRTETILHSVCVK